MKQSHFHLHDLFNLENQLCLFVGSGVSFDAPCNLPTGYQFTKTLLDFIIPKEQRQAIIALTNPDRDNSEGPGNFLRFEQLMSFLSENYDPHLHVLDHFYRAIVPNSNHFFLAKMLLKGHSVFTTNFDCLIECALTKIGIPKDRILPMIFEHDWRALPHKEGFCIHKLHGSCMDIRNGKQCYETLQVTLERIAAGKGQLFQLEDWKQEILKSHLREQDLVILGYSGLDDFDVLPTLWNSPSPKRLIWVKHDADIAINNASIIALNDLSKHLNATEQLDRTCRNLFEFSKQGSRQASQIILLTVNTSQLIDWLSRQYLNDSCYALVDRESTQFDSTFTCDLTLTQFEKWFLTGCIYRDRGMPHEALNTFQCATRHASDKSSKITVCQAIGELLFERGEQNDALFQYEQALQLANDIRDKVGSCNALNCIGRLYSDSGKYREALVALRQSQSIAEDLGNSEYQARAVNNIGLVLDAQGQYMQALQYFKIAVDIIQPTGKIESIITYLLNMAGSHLDIGELSQSAQICQYALDVAEQAGFLHLQAAALNLRGTLRKQKDQFDDSLSDYKRSLEIWGQLGRLDAKAIQLLCIGDILFEQGHFADAKEHLLMASDLFEKLQQFEEAAQARYRVGIIDCRQHMMKDSLLHFNHAIALLDNLEDKTKKCYALVNACSYLIEENHRSLAHDYYSQAVLLAKEQNNTQLLNSIRGTYSGIFRDE